MMPFDPDKVPASMRALLAWVSYRLIKRCPECNGTRITRATFYDRRRLGGELERNADGLLVLYPYTTNLPCLTCCVQ